MLTLEKFEEAYDVVKRVAKETKLLYSKSLSNQVGNKVYFKPENLQHTGAYKIRGAYYKISTLTPEERAKGLVTASAGNHAQGVAYAAKEFAEVAGISGIVLTKMDGTAKGGIAVAIQSELGVPVKYIGVGESIDDLQKFDSDEFVNALFTTEQ